MDLAGKLTTIGLAEVFQNIAFNHHTGTLTLKEGQKKAQIAFDGGKVRAAKIAGQELDYVDIARKCGLASEEVLQKAESPKRRRTLKAFLLAAGDLDEPRYDATIAGYVEEQILPLFAWASASFGFEEEPLKERTFDREQVGCAIALDPMAVAMEAARRLDEWESIQEYVPTEREILVHTGTCEVELSATDEKLLPYLDGTRDLAQVVKEAPLKKFEIMKTVAELVEAGVLVQATAERVRELAVQARTAGKVKLAARRLEVALKLDPDDLETRAELVRLFERAGRKYDAAREQARLGEAQVERGDLEGALESFERAAVLAPDDLDLLERVLSLHEQRGDAIRTLKVGRRLAEALVAQECYEDALPLYERLLESNPTNLALRESFAECLLKLEAPDKAAAHLLVVADAAHDRQDTHIALRYYRRILGFVENHEAARERIEAIESGAVQARRNRQRQRQRTLILVLVFLCALLQAAREWSAQTTVTEAYRVSLRALASENSDSERIQQVARLAAAGEAHPWTRSGALASDTARGLLLDEVARIEAWIGDAGDARTTIDVEATLGRAEKQMRRMEEAALTQALTTLWEEHREHLQALIRDLRAK